MTSETVERTDVRVLRDVVNKSDCHHAVSAQVYVEQVHACLAGKAELIPHSPLYIL